MIIDQDTDLEVNETQAENTLQFDWICDAPFDDYCGGKNGSKVLEISDELFTSLDGEFEVKYNVSLNVSHNSGFKVLTSDFTFTNAPTPVDLAIQLPDYVKITDLEDQ